MIVSRMEESKKYSTEKGDLYKLLISGDSIMFTYIELEPQSETPLHSHVAEQAGICLKGEIEFQGEDKTAIVKPNDVYLFRSNEKHGAKVVGNEKVVLFEIFSPPREEVLARFK
ncbi:cupin domain-containing protein [Candidatus Bathyarchaeota archaeon]|nr:cupin domain-containing protein [Candidatus Bathyarchaeota archaeon]